MNREYNPDIRENDPVFLLRNVKELLLIGEANKNSSALIYACLDCRIALELLDLNLILLSVGPNERQRIIEDSKPKNGIHRVNKKIGILKEKYQLFFQAVCEIVDVPAKGFNFKKSKDLQYKLSTYIHSYYMNNDDLKYDSQTMQAAITVVNDVDEFITSSLSNQDNNYEAFGIDIATIPLEDKLILDEWKISTSMNYEDLKIKLQENIEKRK